MAASEARFPIDFEGNASDYSDRAAQSLAELRERVVASEASVKNYNESLRKLKGSSEDVVKARSAIKSKLEAERSAIAGVEVALLKQGSSSSKLIAQEKAQAVAKEKLAATRAKADEARAAQAKESAKYSADVQKAMLLGVEAAAVAAAAAIAAAGVAFAVFAVRSSAAARTAANLREAITGNAKDGAALGFQVDALAAKLPLARAEVAALGNDLAKGGLRGQVLVDALNAVGQAKAAIGDDAAGKLRGILEAGRTTKRIAIDPREGLFGTGLDFDDVAKEVANVTKASVQEARNALAAGRVSLGAGAEALRVAVEKKLGKLNARQLLDPMVQWQKFTDRVERLTSGINLEPLLKGLDSIGAMFDESSVTGYALKETITLIGNAFTASFDGKAPMIKRVIQGMVIGGLQSAIVFLKLRNSLRGVFSSEILAGVDTMKVALYAGAIAAGAMATGVAVLAASAVAALAPIALPFVAIYGAYKLITGIEWKKLGADIVNGIVNGITARADRLKEAVMGLGQKARAAFHTALDMHSPSRLFFQDGQNIGEGAALGVESKADRVQSAANALAPAPRMGGGGAGGGITLNLSINVNVGPGGGDAKSVQDPSFIAAVVKAVEDLLLGAGVVPGAA